jgi:hypothetical protein
VNWIPAFSKVLHNVGGAFRANNSGPLDNAVFFGGAAPVGALIVANKQQQRPLPRRRASRRIFALLETRFTSWSVRGAGGIERMGGG